MKSNTKPKLKLIPLPKGLGPIPKGMAYLGEGPLSDRTRMFQGMCRIDHNDKWDHGQWNLNGPGHLAAPRDSAIAREILGVKESPKKAKKAPALRKLPKNVKPGTRVVCIRSGEALALVENKIYTIEERGISYVCVKEIPSMAFADNLFRLAPESKPRVQRSKRIGVMPAAVKIRSGGLTEINFKKLKFGAKFCRIAERDGIDLPDWLPALPPVPAGFDRWEPVRKHVRVSHEENRKFGFICLHSPTQWSFTDGPDWTADFYIEAVRDEHKASVMDDASTHIELHQKEIDRMDRKITADPATWGRALMESLKPQTKPDNSAVGLLTEAAQTIGVRARERDVESERSMAKCVAAFNVMFGQNITEEQGWLFMVLLKMSRSTVGHRRDDFLDGAAYLSLAGECALNAAMVATEPLSNE